MAESKMAVEGSRILVAASQALALKETKALVLSEEGWKCHKLLSSSVAVCEHRLHVWESHEVQIQELREIEVVLLPRGP